MSVPPVTMRVTHLVLGQSCWVTTPALVMFATSVVTVWLSSTSETTHGSVARAGTVRSHTQPVPASTAAPSVGMNALELTELLMLM
jgi:hypothetical protein